MSLIIYRNYNIVLTRLQHLQELVFLLLTQDSTLFRHFYLEQYVQLYEYKNLYLEESQN